MSTKVDTIMKAIVAKLSLLPSFGTNIYVGLAYDLPQGAAPAIRVRQGAQRPRDGAPSNVFGFIDVELTVSVDIWVTPDLSINDAKRQVYEALCNDRTLGLTFVEITYWTDDAEPNYQSVGDTPAVFMVTGWTVIYRHLASTPG